MKTPSTSRGAGGGGGGGGVRGGPEDDVDLDTGGGGRQGRQQQRAAAATTSPTKAVLSSATLPLATPASRDVAYLRDQGQGGPGRGRWLTTGGMENVCVG